jgi:hypothetical protein
VTQSQTVHASCRGARRSRFKAVNNRDKNFTVAKVAKRIEQVEASIACGSAGR